MRCFSLTVSVAFGGGSKGEPGGGGDEEVFLRGAYDMKPADEGAVRRIGWFRDVGSIEGVTDLHEGSNLRSIRGTRCIIFVWLKRRWERAGRGLLSTWLAKRKAEGTRPNSGIATGLVLRPSGPPAPRLSLKGLAQETPLSCSLALAPQPQCPNQMP